jgi:hypothetical protein
MAKKPRKKREVRPDLEAEPGTTFSFHLDGNIPSKKNRVRFGAHGTYHDKTFTTWHKQAVLQLAPQWTIHPWISHAKEVSISFTYEALRAKDLTNCAESIMDLLVDVYILKDDSFKIVPHLVLNGVYCKGESKTTIRITV